MVQTIEVIVECTAEDRVNPLFRTRLKKSTKRNTFQEAV